MHPIEILGTISASFRLKIDFQKVQINESLGDIYKIFKAIYEYFDALHSIQIKNHGGQSLEN